MINAKFSITNIKKIKAGSVSGAQEINRYM